MRVAVYGGSFNPPHVGHAMVASWLRWTDRADAVWLVPTWCHPFGKALTPFDERVRWVRALAGALGPWASVSEIEQRLGGVSYTIDTLRALRDAHPEDRFRLVVGADTLADAPRWKAWDAIQAEFAPIVVGRAGHGDAGGDVVFPEVSSTRIRERLAAGQDVSALVPASILELIGPAFSDGV